MTNTHLQVIVVGAGIAGLAAGIALRPFADVKILESAHEWKDVGAAVTLHPGAMHILRLWGVDLDRLRGMPLKSMLVCNAEGDVIATVPMSSADGLAGEDSTSTHRADLRSTLLSAATDANERGKPCEIILGQRIIQLDSDRSVTTTDGTTYTADLIIGADGIRSAVRSFVAGPNSIAEPTGESAYRFLVSAEELKTKRPELINENGLLGPMLFFIQSPERRVIAYPCRGGEYLNMACFVPDEYMHGEVSTSWTQSSDVETLIKAHDYFGSRWKDLMACGKDLCVWQIRDMKPLQTWIKGRTILIGDAAHPMMPHRGAGANMAIEDAEALGEFLRDVPTDELDAALDHVFRVRFKRASQFRLRSHRGGIRMKSIPVAKDRDYLGAKEWESSFPDMVVKKGEQAVFTLND